MGYSVCVRVRACVCVCVITQQKKYYILHLFYKSMVQKINILIPICELKQISSDKFNSVNYRAARDL